MDAMGLIIQIHSWQTCTRYANVARDDTAFADINDYYAFCNLHGRKAIKDKLSQGDKKVIVCIGLGAQWDFMLQLADGHGAEYVKTYSVPRLAEIKFSNHPHIDRLIVIKHICCENYAYCKAVGEYIKGLD